MQKTSKRVLALVLSLLLAFSVFTVAASAYNANYQSETHTVFKHTEQTLAPGVEYYNNYAYSSDGKQMVYYVATADISRDDVVVQTSYLNQYKDKQPGMSKLSEQVAFANQYYTDPTNPLYLGDNYNVVAGVNASFYNMQTGQPSGICYVDGVSFGTESYPAFFAILQDQDGKHTAIMDDMANYKNYDNIWQAVGGQYWLVRDGVDVTADASGAYLTDRHSRTVVGITDDGKVVLMVLDGRQEPFSCGGTMHELAQIMLEAGCVYAMNIDGGGSTTFGARPEGEDDFRVINRPSDGSERSISSGLIIGSLAAPSNVFDRVSMTAADEYVTPGTSTEITVAGVSASGSSADIPAEVTYNVVGGAFDGATFVSDGTVGDATIEAIYEGNVVGSATIHVVVPDSIEFAQESYTIPYSKSSDLGIIAKYGLNEVAIKASDFTFTIEDPAAGTLDGFVFTAAGESEIASTTLSAVFNGYELTATTTLLFGKGSEVIFDFEDGTTEGFGLNYSGYNYYLPNSKVFVADRNNGQVHSGDYALGLNIDYSNSQESGYQMIGLYQGLTSGNIDYYEGAIDMGAWLYIPDEYVGLWVRWTIAPISAVNVDAETGDTTYTLASITSNAMDRGAGGTGVVYSFDEPGWHYLHTDLSQYKGFAWRDFYYEMQFYISDRDGAAYGYYAKNQHNINGDFTVYLDDVTVDYSAVVEDRDAPVFESILLGDRGPHSNDALVLTNGYDSDGYNQLSFSAKVADYAAPNSTGINGAACKAYVDGNDVGCTYSNGMITAGEEVTLNEGKHSVKFVAYDNQGNRSSITRTFTVSNVSRKEFIKVVPHDATLDRILHGSLYWVDIVSTEPNNTSKVITTLNLDSMSKWELEHMEVADGFTASYEIIDAGDKVVKLTIEATEEITATGELALVSIPIRAWELDNSTKRNALNDKEWTYAQFKASNEFWPVATEVRVQQGIAYYKGSHRYFTGEDVFVWSESWANNANMVATQEGKDYKAAWDGGHIHNAEPVEDKPATCTEDGYSGRTYCEVCDSIVDWGTTLPATGHDFVVDLNEKKIICENCGAVDTSFSGMVEYEGKEYYAKLGILTAGWQLIDNDWYYFSGVNMAAVSGTRDFHFAVLEFDEHGKLLHGAWATDENGSRYYYGPSYYRASNKATIAFEEIDGVTYGFLTTGYRAEGVVVAHVSNGANLAYEFDEDGAYQGLYTGLFENKYYVDGELQFGAGLVQVDGDYYFIKADGSIYVGKFYVTEAKSNGLGFTGEQEFGADGKMILRNGIIDGYYYVNGALTKGVGLVKVDGDYYYIKADGAVYSGKFYVTEAKSNGLGYIGEFEFGADGKMILKNGIIDGKYYVDGALVKGVGLVKVDDDYYYIKADGAVYSGKFYVTEAKSNGLGLVGEFEFGADGKMILKNGIVDGKYYVNGALTKGVGLVEVDGDYYYIKADGAYYVGKFYVTEAKSNGLGLIGEFEFDADGKMILKNGIIDGKYYVDGALTKGVGLVNVDGDYYYIKADGAYYVGKFYITEAKANGYNDYIGTQEFGADGKMILD